MQEHDTVMRLCDAEDAIQAIEIGSRVEIHLSKTDEWSPGVVKKCPQWSSTVLTTPGQKNCFILMNKCDNKEYNKEHNREKKWKIKEDCDKENNKVSLVEAWRIRLPPGSAANDSATADNSFKNLSAPLLTP